MLKIGVNMENKTIEGFDKLGKIQVSKDAARDQKGSMPGLEAVLKASYRDALSGCTCINYKCL